MKENIIALLVVFRICQIQSLKILYLIHISHLGKVNTYYILIVFSYYSVVVQMRTVTASIDALLSSKTTITEAQETAQAVCDLIKISNRKQKV